MLNRLQAPEIRLPDQLTLSQAEHHTLPGNIPLIIIKAGSQDVVKIEFVFTAGTITSNQPLLASAANELLDEGTSKHSAAELAELLDYYGAYFQTDNGPDFASVTLYSLNKFTKDTLPYFAEAMTDPAYPEKEIQTFRVQGKQRLAVGMNKVDFLARRNFMQALFGDSHPLGRITAPEHYDQLSTEKFTAFHHAQYLHGLRAVIVSGQPDDQTLKTIEEIISQSKFSLGTAGEVDVATPSPQKKLVVKEDAIQSAIRIGRKMFNRNHEDFFPFTILNTILGGYFGSRLMSNIREDKGYTYGIGSGLVSHLHDGYFFISTEVGADVRIAAVQEIYKELQRLREELIPEEELLLVRNYMIGGFQRSIDGPFSQADRHKVICLHELPHDYYTRYLDIIRSVTPTTLKSLAQKYLQEADLIEIVAGK